MLLHFSRLSQSCSSDFNAVQESAYEEFLYYDATSLLSSFDFYLSHDSVLYYFSLSCFVLFFTFFISLSLTSNYFYSFSSYDTEVTSIRYCKDVSHTNKLPDVTSSDTILLNYSTFNFHVASNCNFNFNFSLPLMENIQRKQSQSLPISCCTQIYNEKYNKFQKYFQFSFFLSCLYRKSTICEF